jgi:hypothetical protein
MGADNLQLAHSSPAVIVEDVGQDGGLAVDARRHGVHVFCESVCSHDVV